MIGSAFTLKQLEALIWVADLGSFRKAARHLNTTQPNISSRIAGLETTLGVILMQRDAGSVRLTDKGREILASARKILREAEGLITVAARPDLIDDRLRLGVTELVACTWLHAYLRRIKEVYPAVSVELTVDLSRNLDRELSAGQLDLAIQTAPFGSSADGVVELGEESYVWVAKPAIAKMIETPTSIAALIPHTILTHARHTQAYVQLAEHLQSRSLPMSRITSSNSMTSCVQMAADGMGVALLPIALVAKELCAGALIALDVDWIPAPLRFAARYPTQKAQGFIKHIAALAEEVAAAHQTDDH